MQEQDDMEGSHLFCVEIIAGVAGTGCSGGKPNTQQRKCTTLAGLKDYYAQMMPAARQSMKYTVEQGATLFCEMHFRSLTE